MVDVEQLKALCYTEDGTVREKPDCRAALINHLILEEMMDIDDAEEQTEEVLNTLDLWPTEQPPKPDDIEAA